MEPFAPDVPRVLVIHRKPELAAERARRLCTEGLDASAYPAVGPSSFRLIRAHPPDAILIDLTELPSYGKAMGTLLREQKATRSIPLVFLKGDPEKAAQIMELLPGAVLANLANLAPAILRAIKQAPKDAALPNAKAVPLWKKLKIREGSVVALLNAPATIQEMLAPLPAGVRLQKKVDGASLILLFVKSSATLGRAMPDLAPQIEPGRTLWVCWPKRSSSEPCDLTANSIRDMARGVGMIDSKLCAMDPTWSATALSRRRARAR